MVVLTAKDVVKRYGAKVVLDGTSFEVYAGDRVGLVDPNGVGKTTLLKILSRREEADAGKIDLHGSINLGHLEQDAQLIEKIRWG